MANQSFLRLTLASLFSVSLSIAAVSLFAASTNAEYIRIDKSPMDNTRPSEQSKTPAPERVTPTQASPSSRAERSAPAPNEPQNRLMLAGINLLDVEDSLARLTQRLSLQESQQQAIRQLVQNSPHSDIAQPYHKQLSQLRLGSPDYSQKLDGIVSAHLEFVANQIKRDAELRAAIYQHLSEEQQQQLAQMEQRMGQGKQRPGMNDRRNDGQSHSERGANE